MLYRSSIIIFGIALPCLLFAVVAGGGLFLRSKVLATLAQKKAKYHTYDMNRKGTFVLEGGVIKQTPYYENWQATLAKGTDNSFRTNLLEISGSFPPEEFQQTSIEPVKTIGGFGLVSAQPSSQVRLSTRGTFRATQKAMLTLETEMPQLQLQELKIDPSPTSSGALNFQFSYTVWEK